MNRHLDRVLRRSYHAVQEARAKAENRLAFARRSAVPDHSLDDRDVVVFVVDCLRSDHLSRAGYARETTPFLDDHGSFTPAVSAASWTYSSVPSILTGLYPHSHGAVYATAERDMTHSLPAHSIAEDVFTLPERFAASGHRTYLTTAIPTAEIPLRGRVHARSVDQHTPAADLVDDLLAWWTKADDAPRFGYAHLGDLHEPLARPEREPFGAIPHLPGLDRWEFTTSTEPRDEFESYRRARIRLYDTLINEVDRQIERFYRVLEGRGEADDTLVVVTGDHGEEFWEWEGLERERFHDPRGIFGVGHGHSLVPEVVDVPLVVVGGDATTPSGHASTVDIAPTILRQLGAGGGDLDRFDGVPLGVITADRTVLAEEVAYGYDQQAVVRGDAHCIHSPHEGQTVLVDRDTRTIRCDADLAEELVAHIAFDRRVGATASVDEATERRLADLGYR